MGAVFVRGEGVDYVWTSVERQRAVVDRDGLECVVRGIIEASVLVCKVWNGTALLRGSVNVGLRMCKVVQ